MALTTAGDLIAFALRAAGVNGVGQTPTAEDMNDGLVILSSLVAQWQQERWIVPDLVDTAFVSTGAQSYTVGPAGNFAIARPARIDSAFARLLATSGGATFDYPIGQIETREEYNQIGLKSLSSVPYAVFYDSALLIGNAYFWPIPPAGQYELHIATKAALPVYTALTTPLGFAPVYQQALIWGLAIQLAMLYGQAPNPAVVGAYRVAMATIRDANTQMPALRMPKALVGRGGSPSTGQLIGGLW